MEEETKCYCGQTITRDCGPEEPKQEKLEEAKIKHTKFCIENNIENPSFSFDKGAKWRQERSYSEEEVYKLLDIVLINPSHITMLKNGYGQFPDTYEITEKGVDYIIEQFKKK